MFDTIFGNFQPFKNDEECFFFHLKALFILKILSFCLAFLVVQKNGLIRKIRLIFKFMTSEPGQQTSSIYILPNNSRSNGNQTMKFVQLLEYNMRNIFVEKSYTKCSGGTIPRPFSKKAKLSISPDQQSKVLYSFFLS